MVISICYYLLDYFVDWWLFGGDDYSNYYYFGDVWTEAAIELNIWALNELCFGLEYFLTSIWGCCFNDLFEDYTNEIVVEMLEDLVGICEDTSDEPIDYDLINFFLSFES